MPRREKMIAGSVCDSITTSDKPNRGSYAAYFWGYWLPYTCLREDLFTSLRDIWQIAEKDYRASFGVDKRRRHKNESLKTMGDMGFSGSTFFTTTDEKYLVKSVPRQFEHSFFRDDLMLPYAEHMRQHTSSLLIRITDFLENSQRSFGWLFGLAPSHHIVMENLLYGQSQDKEARQVERWETWDLKPTSYFYPERDIANGALTSQATKDKLADTFKDNLILSHEDAASFRAQLQTDTALLAEMNAVDYSLFLVRIPVHPNSEPSIPLEPPIVPPQAPTWRTGIHSADRKYVYRASLLDFFWAKHKMSAKAMEALIKAYNVVDQQGPMSVTTHSQEYRTRFLKMCEDMIEVK